MNKQDYLDELDRLNDIDIKNHLTIDLLVREFKLECLHLFEFINTKANYEEDEFGRSQPSWTTYRYWCSNCYGDADGVKTPFKFHEEIQKAIDEQIYKEYSL